MAKESVSLDKKEHLAMLTLRRPRHGNTITTSLASELREACSLLAQDSEVWVVLLQAEGEHFCLGSDSNIIPKSSSPEEIQQAFVTSRVAQVLAGLGKPIIAAINGSAIGQGLEIVLACDIRIASTSAQFGFPDILLGHIPWDGGTQRLPRLVGRAVAVDMLLTGRLFGPEEAYSVGLISKIVKKPGDLEKEAKAVASTIASYPPIAAKYAKETVYGGMDMSLESGLRLETDLNLILHSTYDRNEGITAFLEKRTPRYTGG